jgi:hypothetical protein
MSVNFNMGTWCCFGYSTQYCLLGKNVSFYNCSLVKTSRRAQFCLHGSKLYPLRFCVSSPVSLQKHHCWHSIRLNLMCFELYLGCCNEPLSNLSRYTSSQVYSALYFEMVQLKKSGKWKIFCFRNLSPVAQKSISSNMWYCTGCQKLLLLIVLDGCTGFVTIRFIFIFVGCAGVQEKIIQSKSSRLYLGIRGAQ